ncbi:MULTISPECIES: PA1571 family protein [Pseudomonas]|uniref:Gamma-glutamyltranspeptidase n=1 Tax=Phytopseudomonas flavescens TaxID=29435 RepID=A0A7Y9XP12_9GAMM|nr:MULTISPECIES: PA1571 family protein [Pseudomonas]MCW2291897.1 gamma-glutamyltranspeptidase [Pseudomonas sp. BIGb0408]NYH73532.1 gamma-glutamyltranspeptidase [Pseudomonas flavescens]
MSSPDEQHANQASAESETTHGAVIDPRGREIPITESMIQQACSELDKQWVKPRDENPA